MGTEAVRFVWDRFGQDIETQQSLMTCRSPEDLRKIRAQYFALAQAQ